MDRRFVPALYVIAGSIMVAGVAHGGDEMSADVIYSDIQCVWNWGQVDGIRGYSLGSYTCNIGTADLAWNPTSPLLAMNAYRLHEGRLVQIGQSFVKNATSALAGSGCGLPCNDNDGDVLGIGCRDIYGCLFNGNQNILGPRSNVNPTTGEYPGPPGGTGNSIFKRLQIAQSDLDIPGALYFVEGQYVAADDAQTGNAMNNASYKQVTVESEWDLELVEPMYQLDPAIVAWRDHGLGIGVPDPSVEIQVIDVPLEGRYHVATKVTPLGGGMWRYDYAVRNFNSHRAARELFLPVGEGTTISNVGFHDVDYHSGETFDPTDWEVVIGEFDVTFSNGTTFDKNPDANALRWGTMYNFWFDADAPPDRGTLKLGLFRPGVLMTVNGDDFVLPGSPACSGDVTLDGEVDVEDLVEVILAWGACGSCVADVTGDGDVDVEDLVEVILNWGDC
jgi:hypothetical protein